MKQTKPNLVDPIIQKKIIKTLKPKEFIKDDYWKPTKSFSLSIYEKYIKPNIFFIIIIIIIIIFLIYRYRMVKNNRKLENIKQNIILNIYEKNKENLIEP